MRVGDGVGERRRAGRDGGDDDFECDDDGDGDGEE